VFLAINFLDGLLGQVGHHAGNVLANHFLLLFLLLFLPVATISTTVGEIARQIDKTEIYPDNIGRTSEFRESLKSLRRHKIIDFAGSKVDENMNIQILPSILVILPQDSLVDFAKRLEAFRVKEEDKENAEEANSNEDENAD
jgi:hypothetical protein